MIIVDKKLLEREGSNNPIRIGIIGSGVMGMGVINQILKYTIGIRVLVIYNRKQENAQLAFSKIGIQSFNSPETLKELNANIKNGELSFISDINLLTDCDGLDLLIELTGTIEFALSTILRAFSKGKSVLSFNAELEATLGYFLKKKALEFNVKYGVADGDQPAVTMNLYRFVKQLGLTPLVCGNIKGLQDRSRTPFTQKGFAAQWEMTPEMVTSFADGTKISFEQACIANATGMSIAQRGMLGYTVDDHVDNLMHLYDLQMLEERGGIVDYLIGAKPGPGVFIYAKAPNDPILHKYLKYMKLGEGPLYCFYTPYHLLFLEIAGSICRMVDFDDNILTADSGMKIEVVSIAKTDLKKGDIIDGFGGFKTYGVCETSMNVKQMRLLPMGLAEGGIIRQNIGKDEPVTMDNIDLVPDKLSLKCYYEQLEMLNNDEI
jgi:predicted homoserine dehydrogenase-like protein